MKKETVAVALGSLILGFVLGLVAPKMFGISNKSITPPPPPSPPAQPSIEQFDHAIKEYRSLLEKDPKNEEAWLQLANLYYGTDREKDALECFNKVLEINPDNIKTLTQLGNLYYDSQQPQLAVEYYQRVLKLNPELSDVRVDMATMYSQLKRPEEAVRELDMVIEKDPRHALARINKGIILKRDLQDYKGAIAAWQGLLDIQPDHPQADKIREFINKTKELL
jgi:tetratricopeptide (TPR) repeat protein